MEKLLSQRRRFIEKKSSLDEKIEEAKRDME